MNPTLSVIGAAAGAVMGAFTGVDGAYRYTSVGWLPRREPPRLPLGRLLGYGSHRHWPAGGWFARAIVNVVTIRRRVSGSSVPNLFDRAFHVPYHPHGIALRPRSESFIRVS